MCRESNPMPMLRPVAGPRARILVAVWVAAIAIAAVTVAEVAWAAAYLAVAEAGPWIWLLPVAAGISTAVALARPPAALHVELTV